MYQVRVYGLVLTILDVPPFSDTCAAEGYTEEEPKFKKELLVKEVPVKAEAAREVLVRAHRNRQGKGPAKEADLVRLEPHPARQGRDLGKVHLGRVHLERVRPKVRYVSIGSQSIVLNLVLSDSHHSFHYLRSWALNALTISKTWILTIPKMS